MFERNRVDNASSSTHVAAVAASVTLTTGETISGHFVISAARAFSEVVNGETPFLEFKPLNGTRRYLAKHAILSISLADAPAAGALDQRKNLADEFDPYATLGLTRDAEWNDVREGYLAKAKAYHADRFAHVDLPAEVHDYMHQMSKRINQAYALLEAPRLNVRKVELRAAPIYESRPRA